ncbi:sugar ABC transporter permease [Sphaerisporangium krabiense]|uniref:ABC-type sugar transport system permease subunit n=1 Tax=Sphaerisporangium krabiense TaxID=763782 RepID=A0A7W8ZD24_9ACTN|nr:sugar ABC transporter permease [Sphaerisporangium krabiense]MBB5631771.1 ABC-type sugar transport system permease subunit [Sphaerisporangium krabiense]GII64044.1 sugar ABC transporter permease [Sphaerisporangium krabiense]
MHKAAQRRIIIPFLMPALALLGIFFLYPLVKTVDLSLNEFSRTGTMRFVGLDQYRLLAGDPDFFGSLKNTFLITLIGSGMLFPPAMAIAWALSQRIHGERFFRFVVFAPVVLSVAVVSLMWKFLYHPTLGLINPALKSMGLGALAKTWLGDPATALAAVTFVSVWHGIGIWIVLLCAGFERLPTDVLQAARIDGAGEWRVFRSIMLPMMRDLLRMLAILWVVQSLQTFAFVYILTGGGPFGSTDTVGTLMYRVAFDRADFGYAAAIGVVLVAVMLAAAKILDKVMKRDDLQY